MTMQDDVGAPHGTEDPKGRPRSVAGAVGGITALAWAVSSQPAWSPDGTSLVVMMEGRVVARLHVADGRMSEVAAVEEPLNSHAFPRWPPISDEILVGVAVPYPGSESVVRLAMDGSGTQLEQGLQPDWSPDGSQIAFVLRGPQVAFTPQQHRVMVMDADGGNVREVGGEPEHQEGPVWSPDGNWIAYAG